MYNADTWGWLINPLFHFMGSIFIAENDIPNKDIAKTAPVFLLMA